MKKRKFTRGEGRIWDIFFIMFFLCIGLINMQFGLVMGAAIKPVHLVFLLITIYCVFQYRISSKMLVMGILFLFVPVFPLYRLGDVMEWLKSYAIYFIMVLFSCFALKPMMAAFKKNSELYIRVFFSIIVLVQVIGIIQFFLINFTEIKILNNVFGAFQFNEGGGGFQVNLGVYRAYSIYYEPSVFAWVTNIELAILFVLYEKNWTFRQWILTGLAVISMAVTISSSGLAFMCLLFVVFLFNKTKYKVVGVSAVIGVVFIVILLWKTTDWMIPLDRLEYELQTENTSGYERYVSSFLYLIKTMQTYPLFGRGLGQQGDVDLIGRIGVYDGIHNAVIGFMVAFGLSSLLYIIPGVKWCIGKIKEHSSWWYVLVALLAMYTSTGSFVSLDTFVVALSLIIIAVGCIEPKDRIGLKTSV